MSSWVDQRCHWSGRRWGQVCAFFWFQLVRCEESLTTCRCIRTVVPGCGSLTFCPKFYSFHYFSYETSCHRTPDPVNIEGNAESARVMGLMPWMDYEFQVIASNILGSGEPSMPSHTIRTQQAGEGPQPTYRRLHTLLENQSVAVILHFSLLLTSWLYLDPWTRCLKRSESACSCTSASFSDHKRLFWSSSK